MTVIHYKFNIDVWNAFINSAPKVLKRYRYSEKNYELIHIDGTGFNWERKDKKPITHKEVKDLNRRLRDKANMWAYEFSQPASTPFKNYDGKKYYGDSIEIVLSPDMTNNSLKKQEESFKDKSNDPAT